MTNTYAPELTAQQILNSIYYWVDQYTWAPGIAFPAGSANPTKNANCHDRDFYYGTSSGHLWQYQGGDYPAGDWVDLGTPANAITWCGTTVPSSGSGNELDLFNKYDTGEIYQKIDGAWRNVGSNKGGLPLGIDALTFTDISKPWRSARLGLILVTEGSSPLLATDQGFVVKKDISAGGFIATNQGEVWIGHGREDATGVPKIILDHAGIGYPTLYMRQRLWDGGIGAWTVTTPAHLDLGNLTVHDDIELSGGLLIGEDVTLYRGGTDLLKTNDWFETQGLTCKQDAHITDQKGLFLHSDNYAYGWTLQSYDYSGGNVPLLIYRINDGTMSEWFRFTQAGELDFREVGNKILLYDTTYGIGISASELNMWSAGKFSWRASSRTGTEIMWLDSSGNLVCNSVLGTAAIGALKAGAGGSTFFAVGWNAANVVVSAHERNMRFIADADKIFSFNRNTFFDAAVYINPPSANSTLNLAIYNVVRGQVYHNLSDGLFVNAVTGHLFIKTTGADKNVYLDSGGGHVFTYDTFGPTSSNVQHCGTDTLYWNAVWANYLKYHTSCTSFDSLDDLSLVKNYKTKIVEKDGVETEVIDEESLSFLRDTKGFHSLDRDVGFLLGCVKQLTLKVEALEQKLHEAEAA